MIAVSAAQKREQRERRKRIKAEALRRHNELGGRLTMNKIRRRQDRLMRDWLRAGFEKWRDN
jgi:hypothetical protein